MYVQFYTDYDMKLFFFFRCKKTSHKMYWFFFLPMIVNFQEVQIDFSSVFSQTRSVYRLSCNLISVIRMITTW